MAARSQLDDGVSKPAWIRPLAPGRSFANVIAQFRDAIEGGQLVAGDKLPSEPDLAVMFGISRSVVREALKVLELSGYLEVRRGYGGGTFVCAAPQDEFAEVTPAAIPTLTPSFEQLVEVRLAIEPHAARLASTATTSNSAGQGFNGGKPAPEDERLAVVLAGVVDFHVDISRAANNPVFVSVIDSMRPAMYWAMRHAVEDRSWRQEAEVRHRAIADAVAAGRGGDAVRLMEEDVVAEAESADDTPMPYFDSAAGGLG